MSPKISIIVPVYNVEHYIHKCIDSILIQTFKNFELILVDDGSLDKCGQICDEYASKDKRVRVIHKSNGGVSSARNEGIKIAKGKYLAFVDPDDTIEANMYEILFTTALNRNVDIVVCPIKTINKIDGTVSISSVWETFNEIIDTDTVGNFLIPSILSGKSYSFLSSCNKLYKKSWFDYLNIRYDEDRHHGEDARLNLILLTKINSLAYVKQPLYNYYIRKGNSLTQTFREDLYDYILDNKNFSISLCRKYNSAQHIDKLVNNYTLSVLNYMQSVVSSNLPSFRKYQILTRIMDDSEFAKEIVNCQCPTTYYKLLKKICILKSEKLFAALVKAKSKMQFYLHKVG